MKASINNVVADDSEHRGGRGDLSAYSLRGERQDRDHHAASARPTARYAYARDLADFVSPSAIAVIKRQLYDVPFQTLAEATIDANREMVVALRGSDFREGVASFMEKRPPRFTGK